VSDPSKPPIVVKLGGSVLTRKGETRRARPKVIQRLATEIARAHRDDHIPLVVVHGAGSFGHHHAHRYGLSEAPRPGEPPAGRDRGAALTSWSVRDLHQSVLRALLDTGLPAFSVPPFPLMENRQGGPTDIPLGPFQRLLSRGGVPVTYGDVVLDGAWGFSILSGDTLVGALARGLRSPRALFVSDVPGVLEDLKPGPARVLRTLSESTLEHLAPSRSVLDVTGGLAGKVQVMLALGREGILCGLLSGLTPGLLLRALKGEEVYGSWAHPA
jgi:isopentenyl phosphate kinase